MGSEGLASELSMFHLGCTSKTFDRLIHIAVAAYNQPVPDPMGGVDNQNLSGDRIYIGLESDQEYSKVFPLVTPMALRKINFGGNSAS